MDPLVLSLGRETEAQNGCCKTGQYYWASYGLPPPSLQSSGTGSKEQSPYQSEAERRTASLRTSAGRRGKALYMVYSLYFNK